MPHARSCASVPPMISPPPSLGSSQPSRRFSHSANKRLPTQHRITISKKRLNGGRTIGIKRKRATAALAKVGRRRSTSVEGTQTAVKTPRRPRSSEDSLQEVLQEMDDRLARLEAAVRLKLVEAGRADLLLPEISPPSCMLDDCGRAAAAAPTASSPPRPSPTLSPFPVPPSVRSASRMTYFASMSLFPELAHRVPPPTRPHAHSSPGWSCPAVGNAEDSLVSSPTRTSYCPTPHDSPYASYASSYSEGPLTPPTPLSPVVGPSLAKDAWNAPCQPLAELHLHHRALPHSSTAHLPDLA